MITVDKGFKKKERFPLCVRSESFVCCSVILDGTRSLSFERSSTGNRPTETKEERGAQVSLGLT
jgi:hypothetical protein